MTLVELETLLLNLQAKVEENTAALVTLNNTLSSYATTDDLTAISNEITTLQNNNKVLQNSVAALTTKVNNTHHLASLLDIELTNLTFNDVLQYDVDGKWKNINIKTILPEQEKPAISLSDLSDVKFTNINAGNHLIYNADLGKWTNSTDTDHDDSTDLSNYLTKAEAAITYFPFTGGTITGPTTVLGATIIKNYLHATGNITSEAAVTAEQAII